MKYLNKNKNKKKAKKRTYLEMINDSSITIPASESDNIIKNEEDKNNKPNKSLKIQYQIIINPSYEINNLDGNINIIEPDISDIIKEKNRLFESEIFLFDNFIKKIIAKDIFIIREIDKDGNCFYRSLSYFLTKSQKYYTYFRNYIYNHISTNRNIYIKEYPYIIIVFYSYFI